MADLQVRTTEFVSERLLDQRARRRLVPSGMGRRLIRTARWPPARFHAECPRLRTRCSACLVVDRKPVRCRHRHRAALLHVLPWRRRLSIQDRLLPCPLIDERPLPPFCSEAHYAGQPCHQPDPAARPFRRRGRRALARRDHARRVPHRGGAAVLVRAADRCANLRGNRRRDCARMR